MDLTIADWIGFGVAAMFPLVAVAEKFWPAREFPPIPWWNTLGFGLFIYIVLLNALVVLVLPDDWMQEHRLFDLAAAGLIPSILIGHLLATLAMYAWHRASHSVNLLWRGFHQLHHAPRHLNIYVAGMSHPLDLSIYIALPFFVGLFVLGVDPVAASILGSIAGFNAFLQHANLRTPRWFALFCQRPEAHCIHHQRGLHAFNYSDLPLWDLVFGSYRNPESWQGETGFDPPADQRYGAMLGFVDVNRPALGAQSFGQKEAQGAL